MARKRTPKLVHPKLTVDGGIRCPKCKATIVTPVAVNPHNGLVEKWLLVPGEQACPSCGVTHCIDAATAERHNSHWHPETFNLLRN